MSPSFMFLQNLKNNHKSSSPTTPDPKSTSSKRKLKKAVSNSNSLHPYKEEKSDLEQSRHHTHNPSIQNEITISRQKPSHPPSYRDEPSRYTSLLNETPPVWQYLAKGDGNHQMIETIEQFTERSWSPIPSVHRQSDRDVQECYEENFEYEKEENWLNNLAQPTYNTDTQLQPRISTAATVASGGVVDSVYGNQNIGYHPKRIAAADFWNSSLGKRVQDENAARRQRSLPRRLASETIEPPIFRRDYVPEDTPPEPELYNYIVPIGLDVIFQDEDGNEIARVGRKPHVGHGSVKSTPIIVHDEYGKELYRTESVAIPTEPRPDLFDVQKPATRTRDDYDFHLAGIAISHDSGGHHRPPWLSTSPGSMLSSRSTKTILLDERGNQIELKSPSIIRDGPRRMEKPNFGEISQHGHIENMSH